MGTRGYVKEGLELTPMGSFDVEQGGINSGCYGCNIKSTPIPHVTPVMSPDLICYSGLSS